MSAADNLRAACIGHPHARIAWPHRVLHEGADEIDRLRAALQSIAKNTCCGGCQEAARVAKAALSPTDGAPDNSPKVRTQNDQG